MRLHAGEEIIRILNGELVIRVADERRTAARVTWPSSRPTPSTASAWSPTPF